MTAGTGANYLATKYQLPSRRKAPSPPAGHQSRSAVLTPSYLPQAAPALPEFFDRWMAGAHGRQSKRRLPLEVRPAAFLASLAKARSSWPSAATTKTPTVRNRSQHFPKTWGKRGNSPTRSQADIVRRSGISAPEVLSPLVRTEPTSASANLKAKCVGNRPTNSISMPWDSPELRGGPLARAARLPVSKLILA